MLVPIRNAIMYDVTPCNPVEIYRLVLANCCTYVLKIHKRYLINIITYAIT